MRTAIITLGLISLLISPSFAGESFKVSEKSKTFIPSSKDAIAKHGMLSFSADSVSFEKFDGHMDLNLVGTMPKVDGSLSNLMSGADVFKVLNSNEYYEDNEGICRSPVRWFVVKFMDSKSGVAASVFLLTIESYQEYTADSFGLCSWSSYTSSN